MAIYTEVTRKDATRIAEEFTLGDLVSSSGVKNGSVNTHYLLETKRGRFFAKIDEVKRLARALQSEERLHELNPFARVGDAVAEEHDALALEQLARLRGRGRQ